MFTRLHSTLLNSSLRRAGISEKVSAARIVDLVDNYLMKKFGAEIQQQAQVLYIRNRRLVIRVVDSLMAAEIKKIEQDIIFLIKKETGTNLKQVMFIS